MDTKHSKLLMIYGVFLIGAGLAGFLSNPEKAKTALLSGGIFGSLSVIWGFLGLKQISWSLLAARISTSFLSVAFAWRSYSTWGKVFQGDSEKVFGAVLITLMLAASLAMVFVLFAVTKRRSVGR